MNNYDHYGFDEETYVSVSALIDEHNLHYSKIMTGAMTAFMILCMILSGSGVLPKEFQWIYIVFSAIGIISNIMLHLKKGHGEAHPRMMTYLTSVYLLSFGIVASAADPKMVATMFLVDLVLVAIMLTDRFFAMIACLFISSVVLVASSFLVKGPKFGGLDLTNVILFFIVAVCMHFLVCREKILSYVTQVELEESQRQLITQSTFDKLTGLLYRGSFFPLAEEILHSSQSAFAFGILDIDDFKNINDQYGHQAGDFTLQEVAQHLMDSLCIQIEEPWNYTEALRHNSENIACRLGGDEYIFLIRSTVEESRIKESVQRFQAEVAKIAIGDAHPISVSMGIVLATADDESVDELYRKADQALYQAKNTGKDQSCYVRSGQRG